MFTFLWGSDADIPCHKRTSLRNLVCSGAHQEPTQNIYLLKRHHECIQYIAFLTMCSESVVPWIMFELNSDLSSLYEYVQGYCRLGITVHWSIAPAFEIQFRITRADHLLLLSLWVVIKQILSCNTVCFHKDSDRVRRQRGRSGDLLKCYRDKNKPWKGSFWGAVSTNDQTCGRSQCPTGYMACSI